MTMVEHGSATACLNINAGGEGDVGSVLNLWIAYVYFYMIESIWGFRWAEEKRWASEEKVKQPQMTFSF